MITLRPSKKDELEIFDEMDRQDHARKFVIQTGIETHQNYFRDPKITYLSIEKSSGEFCGYFILVLESDSGGVEFRRIIVDQKKSGIGQAAIIEMENYCKNEFNVNRIWLDVFEDNEIGKHIYPGFCTVSMTSVEKGNFDCFR
jgi:hypothetical protein